MKIVKTASGKQTIKISKKEWTSIGKKAGWMQQDMKPVTNIQKEVIGCAHAENIPVSELPFSIDQVLNNKTKYFGSEFPSEDESQDLLWDSAVKGARITAAAKEYVGGKLIYLVSVYIQEPPYEKHGKSLWNNFLIGIDEQGNSTVYQS
jgi:hypothetical protein